MYTPRTVACKTVTVTEEQVCPVPTVTFLNMPEITFDGTTAHCLVAIDAGAGETLNIQLSTVDAYNGSDWEPDMWRQIDFDVQTQTVDLTWEMIESTDFTKCSIYAANHCGESTGWVETAYYVYPVGVADITAVDLTVQPSTCEAPCTILVSITWENQGAMVGTFVPGYTVGDTLYEESASVTLQPGEMHTMSNSILHDMPAGIYVICPSPN
jgi:hypothetical protein